MTLPINGVLIELTNARSIECLWARHCALMSEFGFNRIFYGYTRHFTPTSLGDPEDFIILSNIDPAYVKGFVNGGLYQRAPMVQWALHNEGAASWRMLAEKLAKGCATAEERAVMAFNASHGIRSGYTLSFSNVSSHGKGAIALIADPDVPQDAVDAIWQEHGATIQAINNVVHLKILNLPVAPPRQALTKRQKEALEWVGNGKTTQDIATIMGLTPATIEKHLRLAREALNVDTTAQAVLKAAFQNQVFVLEA